MHPCLQPRKQMRQRTGKRLNQDILAFVEHIFFVRDLQLVRRDVFREQLRDEELLPRAAALQFKNFCSEVVEFIGDRDLDPHRVGHRPVGPLDREVPREHLLAGFAKWTAAIQNGEWIGHVYDL